MAGSGQTGSRCWRVRTFSDERSIFTIAPLKQGQWFLCYQQETSDAFAELRAVQEFAIGRPDHCLVGRDLRRVI